jgi:class 3 adenylate cyclase
VRIQGQPANLLYLGDTLRENFAVLQVPDYQGTAVPLSLLFAPSDRFLSIGYTQPEMPQGASIDGTITEVSPHASFGSLPMLHLAVETNAGPLPESYRGAPVFEAGNRRVVGLIIACDDAEDIVALPLAMVREKWSPLARFLQATPVHRPEPLTPARARIFISYRSQDPDLSLAQQFYEALIAAEHEVFMAGNSLRLGENWPQRIARELEQCDYFLLLLSPQSAQSEMVAEEVRQVRRLQETRGEPRPRLLPIRVNFPLHSPLGYNLRGYLDPIQQQEWHSPADTAPILQNVLHLLAEGKAIASEIPTPPTPQPTWKSLPPASTTVPEVPGEELTPTSAFYVVRPPIETRCYETIVQPGALIRIKAPRQMGKTSLMYRILDRAEQQGCRTATLNFQLAPRQHFSDLDTFLQWFCASVGLELQLPQRLADYWDEIFGGKVNCKTYFEKYLLKTLDSPLVLALDEVDCIFQYPEIAAEFFAMLRAWHEQAKRKEIWQKFRLIVVHSTEVYIPLNINQSPFNVGLPVELSEFALPQVQDLAQRHGLDWHAEQVAPLMAMVGGHPYLVRIALYHIAKGDITLERLLQVAPTEAGPYGDHLRRHLWSLKQHPELAAAYKKVVAATQPVRVETVQAFKLESMGLVHLQGNELTPRFELYRRYFRERLGTEPEHQPPALPLHLPEESVLAAIVFTDVVNFTAQMEANPQRMLSLICRDFQRITELCLKFEGKVLKSLGDGLLMYFASPTKAVSCAQNIQKVLSGTEKNIPPGEILTHRIGIHFGDVFFSGTDVVGTGVNIAARLQAEAHPGGICISQTVYEVVKDRLPLEVNYMGSRKLKGIRKPVLLYHIVD